MITQGKWEKMRRDIVVKEGDGGLFKICSMIQHIGKAAEEDKDNAQLIVNAPQTAEQHDALLKALEDMVVCMSRDQCTDCPISCQDNSNTPVEKANKVIEWVQTGKRGWHGIINL